MNKAPDYFQPLLTEAQLDALKVLVKAKIASIDADAADFNDYVRLLGSLLSPPKAKMD